MEDSLPPELTELRQFLPELVAEAQKSVPYASALVTQAGGLTVVKSKSEETVNPKPPRSGIRLSVWDGATFHSVATNQLTDKDYLVKLTRELAESVTVKDGPVPDPEPELDKHFTTEFRQDPDVVDNKTKQDICAHLYETLTRADKRIVNAQAAYSFRREFRVFCNASRLLSSDVRTVTLFLVTFGSDGKRQVMNYHFTVGTGHEASRIEDPETEKVTRETIEHLLAGKVRPGEHHVILDPDVAGTLAHESFGHGCELDTMMRGAARASFFIGKRVGSDLVNITDFPGRQGHNGSIFFSDDGVLATEPVVLVKNGILQPTMMTDRYSFLMMKDHMPGLKLSPSGRLENYDHPIYARMTNTYFEPLPGEKGGMTRDELIQDTDAGVLLEKMTSGMEDPLGWGVQLQALRGREIKQGKLTGRIFYQVGMTGYVPDVLASVDGLTTELVMDSAGYCGKGHKEVVRVATGGPYVRCRMKLG